MDIQVENFFLSPVSKFCTVSFSQMMQKIRLKNKTEFIRMTVSPNIANQWPKNTFWSLPISELPATYPKLYRRSSILLCSKRLCCTDTVLPCLTYNKLNFFCFRYWLGASSFNTIIATTFHTHHYHLIHPTLSLRNQSVWCVGMHPRIPPPPTHKWSKTNLKLAMKIVIFLV